MFSSLVSPGDIALASQYNNLRKDAGLFSGDSVSLTYDSRSRLSTIVQNDFSVTLTITYQTTSDLISSVSDGTNTWNFTYSSTTGLLSTIIKA